MNPLYDSKRVEWLLQQVEEMVKEDAEMKINQQAKATVVEGVKKDLKRIIEETK